MKAIESKVYAQVLHGKCHWKFTINELPEWNEEHITVIDVTGLVVEVGYTYADGVFEKPATTNEADLVKLQSSVAIATRNKLLAVSDWTQLPDVPAATSELWKPYRQALRDITAQPEYPININWPTLPV